MVQLHLYREISQLHVCTSAFFRLSDALGALFIRRRLTRAAGSSECLFQVLLILEWPFRPDICFILSASIDVWRG
jgi:hypothetical protein